MTDESSLSEGDRVKFVDVHHAMNSSLKKYEGETGTVTSIGRGYNSDKVLVEFDVSRTKKVIDRWSIKSDRVEKIEEATQ